MRSLPRGPVLLGLVSLFTAGSIVPFVFTSPAPVTIHAETGAIRAVPLLDVSWREARPVHASRARRAAEPIFVARDGSRITVERIRRFLARHGSPMARHAEDIVGAGVAYRIDPRTIVAIAGTESGFGVVMPGYNAWGWGTRHRWGSWTQAIWTYARRVSGAYASLRTGDFWSAARRYNPSTPDAWASHCSAYFRAI